MSLGVQSCRYDILLLAAFVSTRGLCPCRSLPIVVLLWEHGEQAVGFLLYARGVSVREIEI